MTSRAARPAPRFALSHAVYFGCFGAGSSHCTVAGSMAPFLGSSSHCTAEGSIGILDRPIAILNDGAPAALAATYNLARSSRWRGRRTWGVSKILLYLHRRQCFRALERSAIVLQTLDELLIALFRLQLRFHGLQNRPFLF